MLNRADSITSFLAMDIMERTKILEAEGRDIVHLELGEPGFNTPVAICNAGIEAIQTGKTKYTHSLGVPELCEEICRHYKKEYNVTIDPDRIVITNGSSSGLFLAFSALLNPGD